ncbi:hypothetical protein PENSPDRAFT_661170 [Peniophora sp. CONT]|nr:hypothetical protein PENSPDRAFT_661170 [Peniophora sp. CONT]
MAAQVPGTQPPFFSPPPARNIAFEQFYNREILLDITTFIKNLIKYSPDGARWARLEGDEWRAEVMCTLIMNYLVDLRTREQSLWTEERARSDTPGRPEGSHDPRSHLETARGIGQVIEVISQGIPEFCSKWFSDDLVLGGKKKMSAVHE